ncbi:peptidase [Treponema phagedenis]|uniref:Putative membrane protease YugP n=1 Tax=Treponema phagedenis TaxID=162 RepID=A0A0B7GT55_TREPH|nr:zinc metallopeptidase [Treponema phagedenis]EFW37554.1 putative neutral zinc metallopeptidase [Treponema phagedenis F0421]NVP24845.1 zinc metallopeptidase [Treponema phagedenis]QEJ95991.1 zinc metallopeptidase [Treponema phagedenis]QEK01754.1 zinc metallopeptidase [Treponema phagedenis]QEK06869.1 zinc metallopeptidase [Treponema phagedenis]
MFIDSYYLILIVPTLLFSLYAQFKVKSTFSKFSEIETRRRITGAQAAAILLKNNGLSNIEVNKVSGDLTDHYDPSKKVLRLSEPVFSKTSVSAVGVAAHETGHAIQDKLHYGPLVLRSTLVPVANIGSMAGPYLAMAGLIFGINILLNLGIIFFGVAVLFYLVTLPVEIDASRRALILLQQNAILSEEELQGAKKVLTAAALTYIASALTAVASLIRLILLAKDRRR